MNYKNFVCVFAIVLSGCSLLSPVKVTPATTYSISYDKKIVLAAPKHASRHTSLFVTPVTSEPAYNKTQMAYTTQPYQIAYFARNKWIATPAQMLQPLIIQALQDSHAFRSVSTSPSTAHFDATLNVHLLELRQIFSNDASVLHLELRAELINAANNYVIATKNIAVTEPVLEHTPYGGVIAANKASATALRMLVEFCLGK